MYNVKYILLLLEILRAKVLFKTMSLGFILMGLAFDVEQTINICTNFMNEKTF